MTRCPPAKLLQVDLEEGEIIPEPAPQPRLSRKISRTTVSQDGEKAEASDSKENQSGESTGDKPARKRKWGSKKTSTEGQKTTRKASSLPISTDSLKGLIPDIKSSLRLAEPVLEMDYEDDEGQSAEEGEEEEDQRNVKISRTVIQEVKDNPESPTDDEEEDEVKTTPDSPQKEQEVEEKKEPKQMAAKAEPKIIRRISKPTPAVEADEPETVKRSPSPARNPVSNIVHVRNLVRPFTLPQLKELLRRTGKFNEETFWIDRIKSHCYATYETEEEAVTTRNALHNTRWPQSNPKILIVDYATEEEITYHKEKELPQQPLVKKEKVNKREKEKKEAAKEEKPREKREEVRPVREWDRDKVAAVREWDRDKVRSMSRSPRRRDLRRSRSLSGGRERKRRDRSRERPERKDRKGEKKEDEAPAKLLDDLFRKTKATPCIYWLPLTEAQSIERQKRLAIEQKQREAERIKRHSLDEANPRSGDMVGRPRGPRNQPPMDRSPVRGRGDRGPVEDRGRRRDDRSRSRSRRRR